MILRYLSHMAFMFKPPGKQAGLQDCVYFGGFEEKTSPAEELPIAVYCPSDTGLIYLPYLLTDEKMIAEFRTMEIGEAFRIVRENSAGPMCGDILDIERISPKHIVRIKGLQTQHPNAPLYKVMKL